VNTRTRDRSPSRQKANSKQKPLSPKRNYASGENLSSVQRVSRPSPQKQNLTPRNINPKKTRKKSSSSAKYFSTPLLYILRLLILGVGIAGIAGTVLSALDPSKNIPKESSQNDESQAVAVQHLPSQNLLLGEEILPLKTKLEALTSKYTKLQAGVFFNELDSGAYLDMNGATSFSAASTIKIPVMVAVFQDVDAGKLRLDEMLTMKPEQIASGSGNMQYEKAGNKYTALEILTRMITISDNTATNMLIDRLGGAELLNQRFQEWGLTATVIRNRLPDLEGTNTTSSKDLATLMALVGKGELVSLPSRDRMLRIMQKVVTRTLLPQGLDKDAVISHKTGDIGSSLGDAGLIDMPNGKRYVAAVMVKRPHNDPQARELIQKISREIYQYLKQPPPPPQPSPETTEPIIKPATE
jgi:beta-lactamase class A